MKKKKTQADRDLERTLDALILWGVIDKAIPWDLRRMSNDDGYLAPLSVAEFFATRRAALVPEKVHTLWKALCAIEPQKSGMPDEIQAAVYNGTVSKAEYTKHMTRRIAVANEGY
jgi:hypothetical protein